MGRADSPLRDRVIFVEGAPRSGTTWLVTLLATHADIAGVEAESHLFDFGVDRLFDNLEKRNPPLHGLVAYLDREQLVDLVRDLCDGIFLAMREHVSAGTEPRFVVEKTPIAEYSHGLDLERKRDCYPDAYYLHIVREREAVINSLMRAPFMQDRSYERCADVYDRDIEAARSKLGDLDRYLEISFEDLRADPAAGMKPVFEWLGVDSGEAALERVRVVSRDPVSDMGAAAPAGGGGGLRRDVKERLKRLRPEPRRKEPTPEEALAFYFVRALRTADEGAIRELLSPKVEVVHRNPGGDHVLRGEDGIAHLVDIARRTFARRYISEWWASPGTGPGEWWSSAPGKPFGSVFYSALGGDATRVDMAIGLLMDDGLVSRAVVVATGPLEGRPVG